MTIFLGFLMTFNIAMVPLAQSIWGTKLIGYKDIGSCVNSVFMIAFSKGDLEFLLDINVLWSLIFMTMYYIMNLYLLHAAFHNCQTDALKNIVMLYSL